MIGGTIARLAVDHGHDVVVSNSRGPETLSALIEELGPHARAGTALDAARAGETDGGIVGVVEERIGGLVALDVDDAEDLAAEDFAGPRVAGGEGVAKGGGGGKEGTRGHGDQERRAW